VADKRADYFAAGTIVLWDADVFRAQEVRKYAADDPDNPIIFSRRDVADAEPALQGWKLAVDDLFA
jgi:hypothetical protein